MQNLFLWKEFREEFHWLHKFGMEFCKIKNEYLIFGNNLIENSSIVSVKNSELVFAAHWSITMVRCVFCSFQQNRTMGPTGSHCWCGSSGPFFKSKNLVLSSILCRLTVPVINVKNNWIRDWMEKLSCDAWQMMF